MRKLVHAVAVIVLIAGVVHVAGTRPKSDISTAHARVRVIDTALSLRPGSMGTLYVLRGARYGQLGRFAASCSRVGAVTTRYVRADRAPEALVAVDGRHVARGAKLGLEGNALDGGSTGGGVEHWVVATGGEPEQALLDASLVVFDASSGPGVCEVSLRGRVELTLR